MRQLDPRLRALLQPQFRAPRLYQSGPAAAPDLQDASEQAADAIARAKQADAPVQAPQPSERPGPPANRRNRGLRIFDAVLGEGLTVTQARDREDAHDHAIEERVRRRAIVEQAFPGDYRAQIAAEANWEEFGKQLAEGYGVDIAAGGSTIMNGGRTTVAPRVDQFGDRAGVTTVGSDGRPTTQYTAPRGPTFEEVSEDRARNVINLAPGTQAVDLGPTLSSTDGMRSGVESASPPLWGRVVQQESRGNQNAISPKGAFGRAQLMPQTAAYIAQQMGDPTLADRARTDPAVNEQMGQWYLNQQLERFGGSEPVALAAYNAGPEKAAEWVQRFGMPQPGQEAQWIAQIPFPETRNYVGSILRINPSAPQAGQAPRPGPGGGRVVASNPKPADQPNPGVGYVMNPDGSARFIEGGPADPATSRAGQRPVPAGPMGHYRDLRQGSTKIDKALEALGAYPEGMGLMNYLGEDFRQRQDPQGVNVRAAISDIGSLIIHDRSGAAVTAAEAPRLKPFIPLATDTPEAARTKLLRLKELLEGEAAAMESEYAPEQGFRGFAAPAAPRPGPPQQGNPQALLDTMEANRRKFEALRRRPAPGGWSAEEVH